MTEKTEQQAKLEGYLDGFYATYLIHTGAQTGLFRTLALYPEGVTPGKLASVLGLHASYVRIWCQTAYVFDLLEWAGGLFRLPPHMDDLLSNPESPVFFSFGGAVSRDSHFLEKHPQFMKTGQIDCDHHHHDLGRINRLARTAEHVKAPFFLSSVLPNLPTSRHGLQTDGRLLDVGCGPGMFLVKLAEGLPHACFRGIDIDQDMVNYARARVEERGLADRIQVDVGSVEEMAFDAEFDFVTTVNVFHEIESKEPAITNCFRALKRGGQWINIDMAYPNFKRDFKKPFFKSGVMDQYCEMTWGHVHLTRKEIEALLSQAGFGRPLWKYDVGAGRGLYWMVATKS